MSILCILVIGACLAQSPSDKRSKRRVELKRCHLSSPGHPSLVEAKCGFVSVPENWSKPGRKIKIHVAVVAANSDTPQPDPLFFFAGGPGQAATESFPPVAGGFKKIQRRRDIILIDQRGTGKSHPLRCEPPETDDPYLKPDEEKRWQWLRDCLASLSKKADVSQYTTLASIQDFDHVRQELGYEQVSLYGISYGTRVAQSYMRRFAKRVRSVILDGVVPQDAVLGPEVLTNGPRRTKENMLRRCAADASCSKQFPKLPAEFAAMERKLRAAPVTEEIMHPRTGKRIKATLDWQGWSLTLRLAGYASSSLSLVPLLVHTVAEREDFGALISASIQVGDMLQRTINAGLENTVLCSEDWPFHKAAPPQPATSRPAEQIVYGAKEIEQLGKICKIWSHRPVSAEYKHPVVSKIPTLILSGEIDPVTPPENGDRVGKTLSASRHLVVPGHGHCVVFRGCIPKLAAEFVDTARADQLDAACIKRIKPMPFFIDFSGPQP